MNTLKRNNLYDVIVIGAGVSGLACAQKLQQAGQNVLVLEAKERIGGRIHSVQYQQNILDLGASWIHGIEKNPIWNIVEKNNIETYVFNYLESDYFFQDGSVFTVEQKQQFLNLVQSIEKAFVQYPELSVEDALKKIFDQRKIETSAFYSNDLKAMLEAYFQRIANDPFAAEHQNLSAQYPFLDGYFSGDEVVFPQGYAQILQELSRDIDIQLATQVEQIRLQDGIVQLVDQTAQVYCAKKVVLSVSLGVLKNQKIKFIPQLPIAHTDVIDKLGFGSFNKVFLEFDESLNLQQHSDANSFFYYVNAQWLNILDLSKIYHKPMYLMLFGGQASEFIDTATDQEIWQYLYQNLKLCLPNLPDKTVNMIVTRWGADELSLGSFSFPSTGYIEQWVNTLNQSVEDRIFLAGEHCSLQYAGTVHGAYLSGVDRANVLLAQL